MNKFLLLMVISFLSLNVHAQRSDLKIYVTLTPAGDFIAKTTAIKGVAVQKADGSYTAENIEVDLNSLQTGISLRDEHMKEKYLDTKTYPKAVLKKAIGKDGKGVGVLNIRGKDINVKGDYKKQGNLLVSEFTLMLADVGISDVSYKGVGVDEEVKVEIAVPIAAEGSKAATLSTSRASQMATRKIPKPTTAPATKPKAGTP